MTPLPDNRPILIVLAGSNGAGKSTFYRTYLKRSGLRFVNADDLAKEKSLEAYDAAERTSEIREELVEVRESFIFETVFSDPAGDKLQFLVNAQDLGYAVILCFIAISAPTVSAQRVGMRVSKGGHDVPIEKIAQRFPRTLENLREAIGRLRHVWVFDNDDLDDPYRQVATFEDGKLLEEAAPLWLVELLS